MSFLYCAQSSPLLSSSLFSIPKPPLLSSPQSSPLLSSPLLSSSLFSLLSYLLFSSLLFSFSLLSSPLLSSPLLSSPLLFPPLLSSPLLFTASPCNTMSRDSLLGNCRAYFVMQDVALTWSVTPRKLVRPNILPGKLGHYA